MNIYTDQKEPEYKFKVGDYVRHKTLGSVHKCLAVNLGEFDNKISTTYPLSFNGEYMYEYELWQPKVGELCWFWNNDYKYPQLLQFKTKAEYHFFTETNVPIPYSGEGGESTDFCDMWDKCEPFKGTTPSILKGKNDI